MAHVDDLWHSREIVVGSDGQRRRTGELKRTKRYGTGKRWLARYLSPDGRERSRAFDRKVDADRFLATVETDKLRGVYVDPDAGRLTVKAYAEQWFAVHVVRPTTQDQYGAHLRNHIYPALGGRTLSSVKRSDVKAFVKQLIDKELAPSTIEVIYGIAAGVFNAAVEDEKLARTPFRNIALPEKIERLVVPIDRDKALALPDAVVDERYGAPILLALSTGLRQGEVFGMQAGRVDMLRRQVTVDAERGQLIIRKGGPRIAPPKTKWSARIVPLPDVTLEALAEHMRRWPPSDKHTVDGCKPGRCADGCLYGLVFTAARGGPIRRSVFNPRVWQPAVEKVGLPGGTGFHELRHFYASVLIDGGESVKVVQKRLGHRNAVETLNTYSHLWPDSEDRTRTVVENALRPKDESDKQASDTATT